MKRLLLLFILSPVILSGQVRQKAIVDSVNAAGIDMQRVSELINNKPGNKVERIHVSDSGEYINIVVRVHVSEASIIPVLPPRGVAKINTGDVVADRVNSVDVPPLPPPIGEVLSLLVFKLNMKDIPVVKMDTVMVPASPYVIPEMEAIPLPAATPLIIKDIAAGKMDTTIVPVPPNIELETLEDLPLFATTKFATAHLPAGKMDTMAVPVFEENKMQVAGMHLSAEGYSLLEKLEGFSPEPYSLGDGGLTIGFGFFVPDGEGSKWDKGMTLEDAERIIRQKVPAYEDQVKQYINVPLTQKEFDALTMLAYNLGGFSKATSIVNDVNSDAGYDKLQIDWMRFVHSKAPGVMRGLVNRRTDELQVRNEMNYQRERKIQILRNRK